MTRVEERLNGKPIDLERGCAGWSVRFYTATAMDFTRRWNACSTRSCDQFQWRSAVIRKAVGELSWRKTSLPKGMEYNAAIIEWLERTADSQDERVRNSSVFILATKYVQMEKYEEANALLKKSYRQKKSIAK